MYTEEVWIGSNSVGHFVWVTHAFLVHFAHSSKKTTSSRRTFGTGVSRDQLQSLHPEVGTSVE
jgi:hypothetical protein